MDVYNEDNQPSNTKDNNQDIIRSVRDRSIEALVPLLDELEDTPERKFGIVLTAVRSIDKPELLEKALNYAQQIEDKTEKAQALIDIANEATVRLQS